MSGNIQAFYIPKALWIASNLVGNGPIWWRDLSVVEAKRFKPGETLHWRYSGDTNVRALMWCMISAKPKVWKRSPGCVLNVYFAGRYGSMYRVGGKHLQPDESINNTNGPYRLLLPVKQKFLEDTPPGIVADWVKEHEISY